VSSLCSRFPWWFPSLSGMVALSLMAGCTIVGGESTGDDDATDTVEGAITLEIAEGQGFDLGQRILFGGVTVYNQTQNDYQLVYPSASPCGDPGFFNQPADGPAICGYLPYVDPLQQFNSFADAYGTLSGISTDGLREQYFFWSPDDEDDVGWGAVLLNRNGQAFVFWLEGLSSSQAVRVTYKPVE